MSRLKHLYMLIFVLLAGCATVTPPTAVQDDVADGLNFEQVAARLAPEVIGTCETADLVGNCRIRLYVSDGPDGVSNAFQSVDGFGRPFVLVTRELLAEIRNEDELALVLAHEAAHHILNHLARQRADSLEAATILAEAVEEEGATAKQVRAAREVGALVGSRLYAQEYELEADALGAMIARDAGFDALRGAQFYYRIPDPGNHALNTHPPNADRRRVVRDAVLRNKLPGEAMALLSPKS